MNKNNMDMRKELEHLSERCDLSGLVKNEKRKNVSLIDYKDTQQATLEIDMQLFSKLTDLCFERNLKMNSVIQFVWNKILHVFGFTKHTVVGTSVCSTDNNLIGLLIVDHEEQEKQNLIEAILGIQEKMGKIKNGIDLNELNRGNGEEQHDLFDSMFIYDDCEVTKERVAFIRNHVVEKLNISLFLHIHKSKNGCISLTINYCSNLFECETIQELLDVANVILSQISSDPNKLVADLEYISLKMEKQLETWNDTDTGFESNETIHHLFEREVERSPDKIAVIYKDVKLSYKQLNEKSNQMAHYLRSIRNIQPDDLIALCMDKSELMIVSIIGVLKSGAAYVPIDPNYPDNRIQFMLQDTNVQILITSKNYTEKLNRLSLNQSISIVEADNEMILNEKNTNLNVPVKSTNLAYLIYTSGTTGNPKGVMIEHKGVINLKEDLTKRYEFGKNGSQENVLLFTNYVFDPFMRQMVIALLNSQILVLINDEEKVDLKIFYDYMNKYEISHLFMTPSLLERCDFKKMLYLKRLTVGGEELSANSFNNIRKDYDKTIINEYGPSETTLISTLKVYRSHDVRLDRSIGTLLNNKKLYVLNSRLKRLPTLATGELYIGGVGVGRGYLNLPELNSKCFLANPFQTHSEKKCGENARIYKTGDLVRWLPNGELEYLGRNDNQVKIRGIRIELNEIRSTISRYPGIKQCAVIAREANVAKNEKYLVAFYTADSVFDKFDIKMFLRSQLPNYMIPTKIIHIDRIPVTVNGKLDNRYLIEAESSVHKDTRNIPENETQHVLIKIFKETLGVNEVGIEDDFFELGGNSLNLTLLKLAIKKQFKVNLSYINLYDAPTVIQLEKAIEQNEKLMNSEMVAEIKPQDQFEPFPLSEVQQSYFIGRQGLLPLGNVSTHLYYEVKSFNLNVKLFESTFNILIRHHGMLRAVFSADGMQKILKIENISNYHIIEMDMSNASLEQLEKHISKMRQELSHQVLDASAWPLFDIRITRLKDYHLIHFSFDCLILDAYSIRLLFDDWNKLYKNNTFVLAPLKFSFRDYILCLEKEKNLNSKRYQQDFDYWENRLNDIPFGPDLPLACDPSLIKRQSFERSSAIISKNTWDSIKLKAKETRISVSSVLLTAYAAVLGRWSRTSEFLINLPVYIKEEVHSEVNLILGDFTTIELLQVDTKMFANNNFMHCIEKLHHQLWNDLEHTLYSGITVARKLIQRNGFDLSRIIAPVVFTSLLHINSLELLGNEKKNSRPWQPFGDIVYSITQTPQIWLDYTVYETDGNLTLEWDYVDGLFKSNTVSLMFEAYCNILNFLANDSWNQHIPEILSQEISNKVISKPTETFFRGDLCLNELFTIQALKRPENIAVKSGDIEIKYKDLFIESNQLARLILSTNVKPNELVAIVFEKCWQAVLASIAVLNAGAAFVYIDPEYPANRVRELLILSQVNVVLTHSTHLSMVNNACESLSISNIYAIDNNDIFASFSQEPVTRLQTIDDLAYVIFTSGTTGAPKGVMISHRGAVNTILDINHRFEVTHNDSAFCISKFSFDLSIYDVFGLLAEGGTVVLCENKAYKDPTYWIEIMKHKKITIWNTVPIFAQMLAEYLKDSLDEEIKDLTSHVRLFLLSGDYIPLELPIMLKKTFKNPNLQIISLGGATEASIWSILYPIREIEPEWKSIPYGRAMNNQTMYILNESLQSCPYYTVGDIYIGGLGVALGYWKNSIITNERFIMHPILNERLYKTGDLGYMNEDGVIVFLGRDDFQVKFNGVRIELGEIEQRLKANSYVSDCIVLLHNSNNVNHLIAFVKHPTLPQPHDEDVTITDEFKRHQFKLEHNNIRKDIEEKRQLQLVNKTQKKNYFPRKSYRHFEKTNIEKETLENILSTTFSNKSKLDEYELDLILGLFSGIKLPDNASYKYMYPSAGNLYPVQVYVLLGNTEHTKCYYYHPEQNSLVECFETHEKISKHDIEIYLVACCAAIKPLYGQRWLKFCYIEAGCMLFLLQETCNVSVGTKFEKDELIKLNHIFNLSNNDVILARAGINASDELISTPTDIINYSDVDTYVYVQKNVTGSQLGLHKFDRNSGLLMPCNFHLNYPLYLNFTGENSKIVEDAQVIIFFTGENAIHSYIKMGQILQCLQECSISSNIGLCPIGVRSEEFNFELRKFIAGEIQLCLAGGSISIEHILSESFSGIQGKPKKIDEYLQSHLKDNIPEYMLPTNYIIVQDMPLSQNGKIDRKALLSKFNHQKINRTHMEPTNEIHVSLIQIFEDILGVIKPGIEDNFFEIGGNSLKLTILKSKIKQKFNVDLSFITLYEARTIVLLERAIRSSEISNDRTIDIKICTKDQFSKFPLNEIQSCYFIGRQGLVALGNVSMHVYYEIEAFDLDMELFQSTFNMLIKRHGILRAVISSDGFQRILEHTPEYEIFIKDLRNVKIEDAENYLTTIRNELSHQYIDLSNWPLYDIRVSRLNDRCRIHISLECILLDAYSIRLLFDDWFKLYRKREVLTPLEFTFRDYVQIIDEEKRSNSKRYQSDFNYWESRMDQLPYGPKLPLACDPSLIKRQHFLRCSTKIEKHIWNAIKSKCSNCMFSVTTVLLTAYAAILGRWSHTKEFLINLPLFIREPVHSEVNYILGNFTCLEMLQVDANKFKQEAFIHCIETLHRQLWVDLEHTLYNGISVQRKLMQRNGFDLSRIVAPVVFTSLLHLDTIEMLGSNMRENISCQLFGDMIYSIAQTPQVWLDFIMYEQQGSLIVDWDYVEGLFKENLVPLMHKEFCELITLLANESWEKNLEIIWSTQNTKIYSENIITWRNEVENLNERCDLSGLIKMEKRKNVSLIDYKDTQQATLEIDMQLFTKLTDLCFERHLKMNSVIQFVWNKILHVFGFTKHTVVGTSVCSTDNNLIGLLIVDHEEEEKQNLIEAILGIQEKMDKIKNGIDLNELNRGNGEEQHDLFDSMFIYDDCEVTEERVAFIRNHVVEKLNISLFLHIHKSKNGCISLTINYCSNLFECETIKELLDVANVILSQISSDPNKLVTDLEYISLKMEKQLETWNDTDTEFESNETIHHLFEREVERSSDKIAVVYKDVRLSYKQLNEKSNQMAHYLRSIRNIQPDDLIALCMDKSELMIVSIIGVLKSGAAYVPIDPNYPDNRIQFMLQDTNVQILITSKNYTEKFNRLSLNQSISIVEADNKMILNEKNTNLNVPVKSTNLAYLIYTSGTTGNPKGVMIEHKGVINLKEDLTKRYEFGKNGSQENVLLFTNYVFDVSVEQLVLALLTSSSLTISDNSINLDPVAFYKYLNFNKVTHLHGTPSILQEYDFENVYSLIRIVFSGEELTEQCYNKTRNGFKGLIINHYGPTESSVDSTFKIYSSTDTLKDRSIGKPFQNVKCYVLNKTLSKVPVRAIGELYIGGIGLARGYHNRVELTAERFILNPYQTTEEKVEKQNHYLYKTGDLVRWLPNGELEYLGRNDFQVKIRGFRIELGEIECAILELNVIKRCVVLAKKQMKKNSTRVHLVGYYVSEENITESDIISFIQLKLPEYMIPNRLIRIDKIPVNVNGKLNEKALPDVDFTNSNNGKIKIAARNELENHLSKIWSELLSIPSDKISVNDDFFSLGGDSIIAIQLAGRIRRQLNLQICVRDIFINKSIENICVNVLRSQVETKQSNSQLNKSLLEREDLFYSKHLSQQTFTIEIRDVDKDKLLDSFKKLHEHHDALNLSIKINGEFYNQYYNDKHFVPKLNILNVNDLKESEINEKLTVYSHIDASKGPLYSIVYLYGYKDGSARICVTIHQLIADAVSCRIMYQDLLSIYKGMDLLVSKETYSESFSAINTDTDTNIIKENSSTETNGLHNKLSSYLLSDNSESNTSFSLNDELTNQLLNDCNKLYNTSIEDLLLTAFAYTLQEEFQVNQIYLTQERQRSNKFSKNRTFGRLSTVNSLSFLLDNGLRSNITNIKETLRQPCNKYAINYVPMIFFNYLGEFNFEGDDWRLIEFDSMNNYGAIRANIMIINNQLVCKLSTKLILEKAIKITDTFKLQLERVIQHTLNENRCYLTLSDISYVIKNSDYLNAIQADKDVDAVYLANNLQQFYIFHYIKQGDVDDAYMEQCLFIYRREINKDQMHLAWKFVQQSLPTLRLRFAWEEELIQIIDKVQLLQWNFIDLTDESPENQELKIKEIQKSDRNEKFNLKNGSLLRLLLIKQNESLYSLLFTAHHIIFDGWSSSILFDLVHQTYLDLIEGKSIVLSKDSSYNEAQKYLQASKDMHIDYWENELSRIEERCNLSGLLKEEMKFKVNLTEYNHVINAKEKTLKISHDLYADLKNLCKNTGLTLNSILQFVWHKLLNVYGNGQQTVVGTTVSGRNLPIENIENAVGLFINTVPLIIDHKSQCKQSLLEAITEIQQRINEIDSKSNVIWSKLHNRTSHTLDSLFVFENFPISNKSINSVLKVELKYSLTKLNYPLVVFVFEVDKKFVNFIIKYADELFESTTIDDIQSIVKQLLQQLVKNPMMLVSQLEYIKFPPTKYSVKSEINNKTIHELFENEVKKSSNKIAVDYNNVKLTYDALNKRANQLANHIRSIAQSDIIALCLDKNDLMIISILAVWKSGGAYVPIDPTFSNEKIKFILSDTNSKLIITTSAYMDQLKALNLNETFILDLDSLSDILCDNNKNNANIMSLTTANSLAYVIYTSGTTGMPKGVMVEHKSVINLKESLTKKNDLKENENILFFANYIFDVSIEQLVLALLNSNTLVIIPKDVNFDQIQFEYFLNEKQITHFNATPSILQQYDFTNIKYLNRIITGGELLSNILLSKLNKFTVINAYGPTEACVTSTVKIYPISTNSSSTISIGTPIDNVYCYVLNEYLKPVPVGAIGELYIGGMGIARGYLNLTELTDEKFIADPLVVVEQLKNEDKISKVYKTGDLVRWLPNGELEYMGRNDQQVKINGIRLELGEIETALLSYRGIKHCVVVARERQNIASHKYLIGYYVVDNNEKLIESDIKDYLKSKLPQYMIPNKLVCIDAIPVTLNGKLDKKALPEIDLRNENRQNYIEPRNEIESQICKIFSSLLKIPVNSVSISDDFFELGGNSITSVQLISHITQQLGLCVTVKDIFVFKTIKLLYDNVFKSQINAIDKSPTKLFDPFVIFNEKINDENKTLFIFPPSDGGAESYFNNLVPHLSSFKLILFNNYYNYLKESNLSEKIKLEDLTKYYFKHVKELQVNGPYMFCGWSSGGLLALEISRLLLEDGERIKNIFLIDSFFNYNKKNKIDLNANDIYNLYSPVIKQTLFASNVTSIVLFKACKHHHNYSSQMQFVYFDYFLQSTYNNLDTLLDSKYIKVVPMINDSHYSWINNQNQIKQMCEMISTDI